ncbi:MAG: DUF4388 domain-containing protein [Planctomycetota bacterium]
MTLKGQLQHFGLAELFQTLALNQHTGTLVVECGAEKKCIHFATGSISFVSTGQSIRFGEILLRSGLVSEQDIESAIAEQEESGRLVGRILIDRGLISVDDVQTALQQKVEEELYDLFLWERGTFEFLPDYCPEELADPLQRYTQINIDPQAVLMEGLRQLDELRIIKSLIPDFRAIFRRAKGARFQPGDPLCDASVWELTKQPAPITDLLTSSPRTRFQTLRCLHHFVAQGWLQAFDYKESLDQVQQLKKQEEVQRANELLHYLLESCDEARQDPKFLSDSGLHFYDNGDRELGSRLLLEAVARFQSQQRDAEAWEIGQHAFRRGDRGSELLRSLWALRAQGNPKQLAPIREALTRSLTEEGRFDELHDHLDELSTEMGDSAQYWVERGDVCRQQGQIDTANSHYEQAISLLSEKRNLPEIIRLYRQIYDLDPERTEVRKRIQELLALEEERESRKIRRFTTAGGALIGLLALLVYPVRYELRARELFQEALLIESAHASTGQYADARAVYRVIAEDYSMSTQAGAASDRMETLEMEERNFREDEQSRLRNAHEAAKQQRIKREGEAHDLATAATEAEAAGRLREARRIYERLLADYRQLVNPEKIFFPIQIESTPAGAVVWIDGVERGKTPYLHRYSPGEEFDVEIHSRGRSPDKHHFTDDGRVRLQFDLSRIPVQRATFPAPCDGELLISGRLLIVPCRDGSLYGFDYRTVDPETPLWRRSVGTVGHPVPLLAQIEDDGLLTTPSGLIERFDLATGDAMWSRQTTVPITSPVAISADNQKVAFGDESGALHILDAQSGELLSRLEAQYPVVAVRLLDAGVHALTREQRRIRWDGAGQQIDSKQFAQSPGWLLPDGSVPGAKQAGKFVSRGRNDDGTVHFVAGAQWVLWSPNQVLRGRVPTATACAPVIGAKTVLHGTPDGRLLCLRRNSGTQVWAMSTEANVWGMTPGPEHTVFVMLANGKLLQLETGAE